MWLFVEHLLDNSGLGGKEKKAMNQADKVLAYLSYNCRKCLLNICSCDVLFLFSPLKKLYDR